MGDDSVQRRLRTGAPPANADDSATRTAVVGAPPDGLPTTTTEVVNSAAPKAIGPYSQGIRTGNLLFLAGQGPIEAKTNQTNLGTIEEQTKVVLDNPSAVLAAAGMTTQDVVSTTVYLQDLNDFARMNAVDATYFKDRPPARATVQVAGIPRGAKVEISAVASK